MSAPNLVRTPGRSERLTVSGRACIRCHQKKKRCDQKLPKCRLCEQAGVECLGYDAAAVRQVPRRYIRDLEDRVAYLEQKLQEQSINTDNPPPQPSELPANPEIISPGLQLPGNELTGHRENVSSTGSPDNGVRNAAKAAAESIINLSPRVPGQEPAFSQVFLSDIMKNMAKPQFHRGQPFYRPTKEEETPFSDIMGGLQDAGPITLPSREIAQNLAKVYFRLTNLGMPLLHETTLQEKLDLLYDLPQKVDLSSTHTTTESRIAAFFVLEVFAIALLVVQEREPSGRWLADRYHRTALAALNEAGLPSAIEGTQALLLIGQHAYHHPTLWNVWKVIGAALRLAVELGLHQDPPPDTLGFFELDTMRRTFWAAYAMDRNVSTSLYLPCCLSDGAITAKFPSDARDEHITPDANGYFLEEQISGSKRITLHLYRYRQIQSETRRALHEELFLPTDPSSLNTWQQQMHAKIETWYQTTPQCSNFTTEEKDVTETLEVTYNTALFNLYRPSPNIPSPSGPQLLVMAQAATKMIHLYRRFFCQHKLTIYWQAVENISSAGLALLFGYVQSPKVRESMTLYTLNSLVHLCSSVLWGMVEHFPPLKGKRDAFDTASSQVLTDLNEGVATTGENLSLLGQSPMNWTSHGGGQPVSIAAHEDTQLNAPTRAKAPDFPTSAHQTESAGAEFNANVGDTPFSLTDSDILTWMLQPAEGAPGTLPMTWM